MDKADPITIYLQALERGLRKAPAPLRQEWLKEIQSHLHEAAADGEGTPLQRARAAVQRFGPAAEVAAGLMAEALLEHGSQGFRPLSLARGLSLAFALGRTAFALLFALGYLLLVPIAMLSVWKLFHPEAGLWFHPGGGWALSFHGFPGSQEVLGWWLPLIGAMTCVLGWWLLNRLLRWTLARK